MAMATPPLYIMMNLFIVFNFNIQYDYQEVLKLQTEIGQFCIDKNNAKNVCI